jgi:glyoxylate/hydroxypyruvate reductase A
MMTEFAILHVLRHHRQMPAYLNKQKAHQWGKVPQPSTAERNVGFMGLGTFSGAAAKAIRDMGFNVSGWSRTRKDIPGVKSYSQDELDEFLAQTSILVCMLPSTPGTRGIMNAELFAKLPQGAQVINIARGSLLVEPDLIAALDSGHLAAATLDVTAVEPLPAESPLWDHPGITITPHAASIVIASVSAPIVAENIIRIRKGEPLIQLVDRTTGY